MHTTDPDDDDDRPTNHFSIHITSKQKDQFTPLTNCFEHLYKSTDSFLPLQLNQKPPSSVFPKLLLHSLLDRPPEDELQFESLSELCRQIEAEPQFSLFQSFRRQQGQYCWQRQQEQEKEVNQPENPRHGLGRQFTLLLSILLPKRTLLRLRQVIFSSLLTCNLLDFALLVVLSENVCYFCAILLVFLKFWDEYLLWYTLPSMFCFKSIAGI